jgi:hypothetical protein
MITLGVVDTGDRTSAPRNWGPFRLKRALLAAAVLMAVAVYWIGYRVSEPCTRCIRNNSFIANSEIVCGPGFGFIGRVRTFIASGYPYGKPGYHVRPTSEICPDCQGTGGITPYISWVNNYKARQSGDQHQ